MAACWRELLTLTRLVVTSATHIVVKLYVINVVVEIKVDERLRVIQTRNTSNYKLVLVGHSLGAGSAAILAVLLHDQFPDLHCYAYAPPGGLLS
jgi:sn1-specific diacylglycerol lipase